MTAVTETTPPPRPAPQPVSVGPIGRLGRWAATHFRAVLVIWLVLVAVLGFFAPKAEHALSGAGWEATGSESVQARQQLDAEFGGLSSSALQIAIHSDTLTADDPAFQATVADAGKLIAADERVARVIPPDQSGAISQDGHTRGPPGRRRGELERDGPRRRRPQGTAGRARHAPGRPSR